MVFSDSSDSSSAQTSLILERLRNVKGARRINETSVSGLLALSPSTGNCSTEGPDNGRYLDLVRATGGRSEDICPSLSTTAPWEHIGEVAFGLRARWFLLGTPAPTTTVTAHVNGAPVPSTQFNYDSANKSVTFVQGFVPRAGDQVSLTYDTACLP